MDVPASILCPVDFSSASAVALRYAAAAASRFAARLLVLTVEDPLLTEAIEVGAGVMWTAEERRREMVQFAARTLGPESATSASIEYDVAVGAPALEILRVARERPCDLIVMSRHGLTGMRKFFFGSTTQQVLRESTTPILVTPAHGAVLPPNADATRMIRRILVGVDLTAASLHQVELGRRAAEALGVPLILAHVIEPLKAFAPRLDVTGIEADRRTLAAEALGDLLATVPRRLDPERVIAYGNPAEELARIARDHRADLIVMGLRSTPHFPPRMGSVTYRLLCNAPVPVLALPPRLERRDLLNVPRSSQIVERPHDGRTPVVEGDEPPGMAGVVDETPRVECRSLARVPQSAHDGEVDPVRGHGPRGAVLRMD